MTIDDVIGDLKRGAESLQMRAPAISSAYMCYVEDLEQVKRDMRHMTLDQKHLRDWYYRVAVQELHGRIMDWMRDREKDRFVRVDELLTACERDADMCAELIEQRADRLRFINWKDDKKGRPLSCEVVWDTDPRYIEAKRQSDEKRRQKLAKARREAETEKVKGAGQE